MAQLATDLDTIASSLAALDDGGDPAAAIFRRVYRGPRDPLTVDELPAVMFTPDTLGSPEMMADDKPERVLQLSLAVVCRIDGDETPDTTILGLMEKVAGVLDAGPLTGAEVGITSDWDMDGRIDPTSGSRMWAICTFEIRRMTNRGAL